MRYEVIEQAAGKGGFGRVDKARDTELERDVAIKFLDPIFQVEPSKTNKARFRREAKILASLGHQSIPAIYDIQFSESESEFKIIFEWVEDVTFAQYLMDRGVMSLEQAEKWFGKICSALSYSHDNDVIHRDIKPQNIIIEEDYDSCYVVDFGVALNKQELESLTGGDPIGTPGYMSPEQENGERLGPESDIFSLGVVLYECLAGTRPKLGEYTPLNSINEAIPPGIDQLIRNCFEDRETRLSSADEFYRRLKRALQPHADFSSTLSQGSLHEIQIAIGKMTSSEYANLPAGQRRLIRSRVEDLVEVDEFHMRNAISSLLSELVRVGYKNRDEDYSLFAEKSMQYAYEKEYSENWHGNQQLREALNDVALKIGSRSHILVCNKVSTFIDAIDDLDDKQAWYYHDLRVLCQNLLANVHCNDDNADKIGNLLDVVNKISNS